MRWWPRSLQGQLLLAVAIALLVGQAINGLLLYRVQTERREAALIHTVTFRLYALLRDGAAPPQPRRMRRPELEAMSAAFRGSLQPAPPALQPRDRRLTEAEADLRTMLAGQGIALNAVQIVQRSAANDPFARQRLSRHRANNGEYVPRQVVVAAAQRVAGGSWAVVWIMVPPPPARAAAGLLLMTAPLIYALLVGAIALVLRRLAHPLTALTRRVEHFAATRDARDPLPPSGPLDIALLIVAHNDLEARIAALLNEKDVMLGAIGHDLKTPLAALRVRIENVSDPAERARMAATIDDISSSLDDILSLARVGRPSDPIEVTDLTALIALVVDEFEDMGEAASFAGAERITMPLRPTWLRRALRNLISNALRYGKIAQVSLERRDNAVVITVTDEGPGIPAADLARMLEPFTRGDPSRNRGTGGAGLGLTLARAIAEQHGGTLTLTNRSTAGGDTTGLIAAISLPVT